jgi:modulator of FtsH protease HflK
MEQNVQKTGVINWLTLLVVAGAAVGLARYANAAAGLVGAVFLGLGFAVAAVSSFQMRLADRERLERLEFEELRKARGGSTIFTGAEDSFTAQRSRLQFEKYFLPVLTVLLFLAQVGAALAFWPWLTKAASPTPDRATITMALFALFALVLFLLGKYSAGLARLGGQVLLRPSAGYLTLGAMVCLLVSAAEAAAYFGFPKYDVYLARAFCAVLVLTATETLVNLVFEIYRPRVKGQAVRLIYESRLIGLLGQPGGLITTAAQALDYQFGFKVSETWFYRFLEEKLALLFLLQVLVLWGSTTFVIIEPDEQALLERFGRPVLGREVLGPGLHFKWPWPADQIYRYPAGAIQAFVVGVIPDRDLDKETTIVWTRPHYKEEFNMLVASRDAAPRNATPGSERAVPANLLTVSIPVQYQITNLVAWAYQHAGASNVLEDLANREVVRYLVNVDFDSIMSSERMAAGDILRERIQRRANALNLGVSLLFVGLQDIHPPIGNKSVPVAAAFEQVVGAMQQKQTNILAAQAYEAEHIPSAYAEATNVLARARGDQIMKVATAAAEAARFTNQTKAWQASPTVYAQRAYLDTLVRSLTGVKKYVLGATNTQDVLILNLEDPIREDLLSGVALPPDAVKPPSAGPK